jgi:hypothetical protein
MAIGSPIFDFSTSCSALRSRAHVHANRTRVGASPPGIFQRVRGARPDGYRRKYVVCIRDCADLLEGGKGHGGQVQTRGGRVCGKAS